MGSKYADISSLKDFYHILKEEFGIDTVLHAGDLTDGNGKMYRGQLNDLKIFGFDDMVEFVINEYPIEEGVRTFVISGNHDDSFLKSEGANIVKHISNYRDDIEYIGQAQATIYNGDLKIELVHPRGGRAYARSYNAQKYVEQNSDRPDIVIRGHHHVALYMPYLDTDVFEAGCFQKQTPFEKEKGLYPQIGGWVVELEYRDSGLYIVKPRWFSYK